jgi:hypothetical protein
MRCTNFRDNILIIILKTKVDDCEKIMGKKTDNILLISEHNEHARKIF